ncbi:MAG: glycosyltransferase family 4 protein [Acidimicrobiia bacterium]|nr:glycosyltransferase family 4 protein [Acidimicrobiia bacterium]
MSAVVIDWLGRGGIAQTTPAWVAALRQAGHTTTVVTRGGRELGECVAPPEAVHPILTHRRLAALAARIIEEERPDLVVIQNYVLPPLETALDRTLARTGTRSVVVVHDHRLHSPLAGTRAGLRRRLRRAETIVTHSQFVADAVRRFSGREDILSIPLPLPLELKATTAGHSVLPDSDDSTALLFGIVKRRYKGIDVVQELAATGIDGWRLAAAGVGAPTDSPGLVGVDAFIPGPDLIATIGASEAVILPYRIASQSAAVVLAQSQGTLPIATAVGGIPEQITAGVDGCLVSPTASIRDWRRAIESVADLGPDAANAARERVGAADRAFYDSIHALV